jgi:hypothetical protein
MPTKQVGDFKLAFISQDGTITVFGDATEIIEECPTNCYFNTSKDPAYLVPQEFTFTATCNCNLKLMYLLVHGHMPTSNWLRMHGMKPKRKDSRSKKGRGSNVL